MDSSIKELIKKEKERRKLLRKEKIEKEKVKADININSSENSDLKIPQNLFLNIQNNYENNVEDNYYIENENENKRDITKKDCNYLNEEYYKEPTAPINKLNKSSNLKEAFSEYTQKINDNFFEQNENKDTNNIIVKEKITNLTDTKNEANLPKDFFDSFKIRDNKNNESEIEKDEKIEVEQNFNNNSNNPNENDDQIEILETYEIIEPTTYLNFEKNGNFLKKKLKKRKKNEDNENEEDEEEDEIYKKKKKEDNTDNYSMNEEIENNDHIMKLLDNNLDELVYYKPLDTAYYEELDYLHKMLIEKKKNILGNMYDEEKEKIEENDMNILEEINEFHKQKNIKENEKNSNFKIDEIYELLNIKKGEHINDYLKEVTKENKENNSTKKNRENENIPKGFFDDKEKDIFIREKISLSTLNQKIIEIIKQKKKFLLEYKNVEKIYEEKKNSYIDYLYDDKYENKTKILDELKTKTTNLDNVKNKIKEIRKEKKKKKKIRKKKSTRIDDTNQILSNWRKKSFF